MLLILLQLFTEASKVSHGKLLGIQFNAADIYFSNIIKWSNSFPCNHFSLIEYPSHQLKPFII